MQHIYLSVALRPFSTTHIAGDGITSFSLTEPSKSATRTITTRFAKHTSNIWYNKHAIRNRTTVTTTH